MPAGALRHRVTFQREVPTPDGGGGSVSTWEDRYTVWASLRPERGSERLAAGRLEASLALVMTVRSSSESRSVTEAWRVVANGVPHQIRSISNPDQRNKYLEMILERGVGD